MSDKNIIQSKNVKMSKNIPEGYKFDLPFINGDGLDNVFRDIDVAPELPDVTEEFKILNCYNNIESLMRANVKYPYLEEHKKEFKRCKEDILYFLINYATIPSLDSPTGIAKFNLYQYQKNMIKVFTDNRFSINLLPRQMGKPIYINTPIWTKDGYKKLNDIKIGDEVLSNSLKYTKVINTTKVMKNKECYKISFSKGEDIISSLDHDWIFYDSILDKDIKADTKYLYDRFKLHNRFNKRLLIKQDILLEGIDIKINNIDEIFNNLGNISIESIITFIFDNYNIEYLNFGNFIIKNAIDERIEFLLNYVGYTYYKKDNNLFINIDSNIYITNVEKFESVDVKCITVEDDSHLFLVGSKLIPTHNCYVDESMIKIRNKKTNVIEEISMKDFLERIKKVG